MMLLACLLLVCGVLSSCTSTPYVVTVTRHHRLPPKGAGETFMIFDGTKDLTSLRRADLAARISAHLVRYGWKPAPPGTKPNYGVALGYATNGAHRESFSSPIYASRGGGMVFHEGTVKTPGGGSASYSGTSYRSSSLEMVGVEHYTLMMYDRELLMEIKDMQLREWFSCKANSTGTTADVNVVVPYMVDAVFKKFPGVSGRTQKVTLHE